MKRSYLMIACFALAAVLLFAGAATSTRKGYVLRRGEGEKVFGGATLIKASPVAGSQNVEMFWSALPPGFVTGVHVHEKADEFFYIIKGTGVVLLDGKEVPVEAGDFVFVPKGDDHRLKVTGSEPLETIYLVDRPGLASEFREAHAASEGGKRKMTLEELNRITVKFGTRYKTLE